jgi:signal transduction histidine kinase
VLLTRRVELQQVLLNLMLNARAAVLAREGARRIEISARGFDDAVVIAVSDTGIGIKTEDLERVFQPFFTTKAGGNGGCEGNGLGLTVCREIVQEMGGQISVQSAPGAGATFTVYLPRQGAGC